MLILGIHKDESNNTIGNYIVEGTKPSTKDKVINVETQYYENPGHHDLKDGNMPYNSTKAIIPDNHVKLWENSVKIDSDPKIDGQLKIKMGRSFIIGFKMMVMAISIGMVRQKVLRLQERNEISRFLMSLLT
ncbi:MULTISPECIES: hypothetical protein [unclassified Acinetobacter]|uniref:hypothetical protein n=1 Tax=unclassified Acinetobacter TaxID=196816 RepID=UPI0015D4516C|nr:MULTISPECIES: hypothetical protein [unclassified Acinetobacter]